MYTIILRLMETTQQFEKKKKGFFRELIEVVFFVALIVIPIQTFIGRTFIVVGNSMYPTFENKDYLIVDKFTYQFNDPKRGDVVVFHPPINKKTYYIKRVIGLPFETVQVENNVVTVINAQGEQTIIEPYVSSTSEGKTLISLKENEYFVMGDNRAVSSDSRAWGVLPRENISGRAFVRLFPFRHIDLWPGEHIFK